MVIFWCQQNLYILIVQNLRYNETKDEKKTADENSQKENDCYESDFSCQTSIKADTIIRDNDDEGIPIQCSCSFNMR